MLQKAIIEKKLDKYSMKVRIPVYNKVKSDPTATPTNELYTATIQTLPGCSPNYQEGDVVIVDFENDDLSFPIIIGLLYREHMPQGSTDITADSLVVNVNTNLSENTLIGEVTPDSLKKLNDKYSNNVKAISIQYSLSNYQDHYDSFSDWSEQAPQYWPGKFMWQRTTVTYEDGTIMRSMTCIQGAQGSSGSGVTIEETYVKYAISSNGTTPPDITQSGIWFPSPPKTTDVNPYLWSWTYTRFSDGKTNSAFGVSRVSTNSAIVYLYKRSIDEITAIDWTESLTYDFDNKKLTAAPTGWSEEIPSGSEPLYVTAATASSITAQATIPPAEWSVPTLFSTSGLNSKTVLLYKRYGSTPATPSTAVTYTFSTGAIQPASPDGWSLTIPTTDGNPCYVTQATAIGYGETYTIQKNAWYAPTVLAKDGNSDYIDQPVVDWYIVTNNTNIPTSPTAGIEVETEWTGLGWTQDMSSLELSASNKYLWNAEVTHYTISGYIKTSPHIITMFTETGKGIQDIVEYYALSTTTTRPTTGWSTDLPSMDATNRYLWNYSVITYTDGTASGSVADALIIGVYGDSVLSVEIQADNGTLFNSKATSTTLSADVYLGVKQLTVSSTGVVKDGATTMGQLNWFAKERFTGNGTSTTFDLGLDILNATTSPKVEITINGTTTTEFTVVDKDTIKFNTAPADESIILIQYLTSTSDKVTVTRTDVRGQVVIICKVVSSSKTLALSEVTIKDLNDASSLKSWYMLTVDNVTSVSAPSVVYDENDSSVVPTGEYKHKVGDTEEVTVSFTWQDSAPVVNINTVSKLCYTFQMIIFSDNSCTAGTVERSAAFDAGVVSWLQAQEAKDAADNAQSSADNAQNTANDALDGTHQNAENIQHVQQTLTAIDGVLAAKLDTVTFTPYKENIDSFMQFDVEHSTMTLGKGNFKQQMSPTKNSFMEGSTEVAYISNQELYINNATVNNKLSLDEQWVITFDSSNGLIIKHI
jgi:hypothetical protein|nr:MAG TPA: tail fiber protein [Caudoviricetes sp.]